MSAVKRKLKTLSLAEKLEVFEALEVHRKEDVAEQFGIPMSTLYTLIKNKSEVMKQVESGQSLSTKRQQYTRCPLLEDCLLKYVKNCREQNVRISGKMLQEKAVTYSKSLGMVDFKASNGWLDKFKKRHEPLFKNFIRRRKKVKISETTGAEVKEICIQTPAEWSHEFVPCNDGTLSNEKSIDSVTVKTEPYEEDEDEDEDTEDSNSANCIPHVSIREARTALNTMWNFIEQCSNSQEEEFSALYTLGNAIDRELAKAKRK